MRRGSWVAVLVLYVGCEPTPNVGHVVEAFSPAPAASGFIAGTAPDGRAYKLYVPPACTGSALPIVVMIHGCTQDPDDFATGTRMNTIAETEGFFALYPQQTSSGNSSKCWNWFQPADQSRGSGEPASIVGTLDAVASTFAVDGARTYALGISSGGAMAVILGGSIPIDSRRSRPVRGSSTRQVRRWSAATLPRATEALRRPRRALSRTTRWAQPLASCARSSSEVTPIRR